MNAPVDVSFFARAAKPLTSYRKYWASRFGTAKFLPMSARGDGAARLGQLRHHRRHGRRLRRPPELRHGRDRPRARGAGLSRRHHRAARLAERRALQGAGQAEPVLRRHRRQHGFDDQPLHGRPQDPQRRRLHARATSAASGPTARPSCIRSAAAKPRATCRSSWAASKAACAASRITTTGRTRSAARSWSMPSATCCCTATPSAPSSRSRIAWPRKEPVQQITDVRGTAFVRRDTPEGWFEIDSTERRPAGACRGARQPVPDDVGPGEGARRRPARRKRAELAKAAGLRSAAGSVVNPAIKPLTFVPNPHWRQARIKVPPRDRTVIRLPSYEQVQERPGALRPRQPRAAPGDQPRQCPRTGAGARRSRRVAQRRRPSR